MSDLKTIRTDVVGSLLRPQAVKDARARFDEGKIDGAALRKIEDEAIRDAVRLQDGIGKYAHQPLVPGAKDQSPTARRQQLAEAACAVGVDCLVPRT